MACHKEVQLACNISFDSYNEVPHFDYKRIKLEGKNTVGYVVETEDYNVLVFRGTDQLKDWLENLMFLSSNTRRIDYIDSAPYHTELKAVGTLWFPQEFPTCPITGGVCNVKLTRQTLDCDWSLPGWSFTSVVSLLLDLNNPMLITFGSPDWGNRDATWMVTQRTSHYLRFVNGNDIVCCIYRPFFTKPSPAIRLQSKNSRHPFLGHLEYRESIGITRRLVGGYD